MTEIAVIMGSTSDYWIMEPAIKTLSTLDISCEARVLSAHRTPDDMLSFAHNAQDVGYRVIIAGAGGAAHLPGMVASATLLPVIGVPVKLASLSGLDSLLSIVQMPAGVPVATVGVNNATNAALLAARILALFDPALAQRLHHFTQSQTQASREATLPPPKQD
ncbi:MAG: 5-(carboxyamino)imidazole ribonucleotide mutase [Ferrimicrobium sp.]